MTYCLFRVECFTMNHVRDTRWQCASIVDTTIDEMNEYLGSTRVPYMYVK
jgi:hypothetical protein